MIAEDPMWEYSVYSMSLFDPVVKVSLADDIIWSDAAKAGKLIDVFYQLFVDVNAVVWCCLNQGHLDKDLCLFDIDLHSEEFVGLIIWVW